MAAKKLGTLVKEARTASGMTQTQLASKVSGLTASDIGKIERGEKGASQAQLKEMAKALGVTQKSLLEASQPSASSSGTSAKKKTSSSGKTSSSASSVKLTAAEKKMLEAYRKADASTKKLALNILEGKASLTDIAGSLLAGGALTGSGSSSGSSSKDPIGSALEGILGNLMKQQKKEIELTEEE